MVIMSHEEETVLQLQNFGVAANGHLLIQGLNLTVSAGDIVGLTGQSGCGKTTLLRAIAGLINPAEGEVLFQGRRPGDIGWPKFRRMVSYMDQTSVMLNASVETNLRRPFAYAVSEKPYPEKWALELIDALLLDRSILPQNARQLSVGQMQRVSLIRSIIIEPRVLLLDEPTSAMDDTTKETVERLIVNTVRARNIAALIVTHDTDQAARLCTVRHEMLPYLTEKAREICRMNAPEDINHA